MPDERRDEAEAARWWALADSLLPGTGRMPRPSAVDGSGEWTRRLLSVRPDLCAAVRRAARSEVTEEYLARIETHDPDEFLALATVVAGAHYLNPVVRQLIGYPGQEPMAANAREDGLDDDLLRAVRDRRA
jgi:hypothetical protein